jgi:flagellar protein FliJ
MARLDSLLKVRQQAVDDKQRFLADLYRQQEQWQTLKDQTLLDLAREQALVESDVTNLEARAWFGQYAQGVAHKLDQIDAAMHKLDTRILVARDDVRAAFAEYKKIEITDRERKRRDKQQVDALIAKELDDQALENFRRREE